MFVGNATVKALLPISDIDANVNGTGIDVSEYDAPVAVLLNSGAGSGNMTMDVKLQDCATVDGTYVDIAGATFTRVTTSASSQKIVINPSATSKFVRVVATVGGTDPQFAAGVQLIGEPKYVG